MPTAGKTPECGKDMHRLCPGPAVVRRKDAPPWEAPLMTLHCGCPCHDSRKRR